MREVRKGGGREGGRESRSERTSDNTRATAMPHTLGIRSLVCPSIDSWIPLRRDQGRGTRCLRVTRAEGEDKGAEERGKRGLGHE